MRRHPVRWYRRGVSREGKLSYAALAFLYKRGAGVNCDYAEALRLFRMAFGSQCTLGAAHLGVMYRDGLGVARDVGRANSLFLEAVADGGSFGESCMGFSFLKGIGVDKNEDKALLHFRHAVEGGSGDAEFNLGTCYKNGYGVDVDVYCAVKHFQESARLLNREGQFHLAECHWSGLGVEENKEEALDMFWKAADNGSEDPLNRLASLLCAKSIEVRDSEKSARLLQRCIKSGCASCKVSLGQRLLRTDEGRAYELLQEAASNGNIKGLIHLGICFLEGVGTKRDPKKALNLFNRASETTKEAFYIYWLLFGRRTRHPCERTRSDFVVSERVQRT